MEMLEDRRRKLMKSVNLTEDGLNAMRPAATCTAKLIFDTADNVEAESVNKKLTNVNSFETQKDVIHYVEINEYLI